MNIPGLSDEFFSRYGHPERQPLLFFAPGRVNLIGEHTDYNGGFVLPCALQFGTYLLVRKTDDGLVTLASSNFPETASFPVGRDYQKQKVHWFNYPLGVLDRMAKRRIIPGGMEMLFAGDIPDGAGLSSSASIEMATAFALNEMAGSALSVTDLSLISQAAEHEFAGVRCGIMDQFAVGMGKRDHALFLNCRTLEYKDIRIPLEGYRLVIVDSKKKRGLSDSKYNERVKECMDAVAALRPWYPVTQLGEIGFMQFFKMQEHIADEMLRRRARHVISENQRVLNSVSCLLKGDLEQFGALMNASHESLRDNYEVTGPELDTLSEEAWKVPGVIGARMTGAGFGGCTVNLVREDSVELFQSVVGEAYRAKTGLTAEFYPAEIGDGVRKISSE